LRRGTAWTRFADARGDTARLRRDLFAAGAWAPFDERVVIPLVRLEIQGGALADAAARPDLARQHGLDPALYAAHQAWIAGAYGDQATARAWLSRIPGEATGRDPRVAATLALMGPVPVGR